MGEFRVAPAFEQFCKNLNFSLDSYLAIISRYHSITRRINEDYWDTKSDSDPVFTLVHMVVVLKLRVVTLIC